MPITDFRDHTGEIRLLGRLEPNDEQKKMRAARTNIQAYRAEQGLPPTVPTTEWMQINRGPDFGQRFVINQGQYGACVGFSNATAEMKSRYLSSGDFQIYSGAFTYALINGGRDQGAVITDAMESSLNIGNVLQSEFGLSDMKFAGHPQVIPAPLLSSAASRKATFCMTVGSWAECMTAVQMGFVVQFPIQVGSHFEVFDANGVCGYDNGPGNHSVHADSAILLSTGEWILEGDNTWGTAWGWNRTGRMRVRQRHIDGCAAADDAFAHVSVTLPAPPIPA